MKAGGGGRLERGGGNQVSIEFNSASFTSVSPLKQPLTQSRSLVPLARQHVRQGRRVDRRRVQGPLVHLFFFAETDLPLS